MNASVRLWVQKHSFRSRGRRDRPRGRPQPRHTHFRSRLRRAQAGARVAAWRKGFLGPRGQRRQGRAPRPGNPRSPRKRVVPSARVPPTNTARARRVPLRASLPGPGPAPRAASASMARAARAARARSLLRLGGCSQEAVRCWHPKSPCSPTDGSFRQRDEEWPRPPPGERQDTRTSAASAVGASLAGSPARALSAGCLAGSPLRRSGWTCFTVLLNRCFSYLNV